MGEFEKRIREASPYRPGELPPQGEVLLSKLLDGSPTVHAHQALRTRRKWRPQPLLASLSGAMAVVVVFVAIFISVLDQPIAAVAATPTPLNIQETGVALETLREDLRMSASDGQGSTRMGASYEGWYLQLDEERPNAGFIQPQQVSSRLLNDGSVITRVLATGPMTPDGEPLAPLPPGAEVPGTLLSEVRWEPGEYEAAFPLIPPDTSADMQTYLQTHLREQGAPADVPLMAGDYAYAAVALMQTWTLNADAQRALVGVLLDAPGVRIAGSTTDRAGRAGVVLDFAPSSLSAPGVRERLVIDTSQWRVIASESIATDGIPDHQIPADAVTSYTLWR